MQAANAIIAMAAGMVTTCRISAPPGRQGHCARMSTAVKQRQSWVSREAPCANQHEHLPPAPARLRCKSMSSPPPSTAHVLERTSVKLAVHEQREVDLTGQRSNPLNATENRTTPSAQNRKQPTSPASA